MNNTNKPLKDRFFEKVSKTNGCWIWNGYRNWLGYGKMHIKTTIGWKVESAHRISYKLFIGKIPKGLFVLHKCDNPPCVNPEHLWVGTQKENCVDRMNKGRGGDLKGENNGNSKLTLKNVKMIRKLYSTGKYKKEQLGQKFHVHRTTINRIILGRDWNYD